MAFSLQSFLDTPTQELLDLAKKTDLLDLAKHYQITEIKSSLRKQEIKNILFRYLVEEEILEESALCLITEDKGSDLQLRELELKFALEQRKLELEQVREREQRQHELRLKELELQSQLGQQGQARQQSSRFDITKHIRLVPPFQEKEVDQYFMHFEKVAENLKWPKDHWTLLLQSTLIGKAREIYTQLSIEQSSDYDYVKQTILKGYELVPEAYRQKFRSCRKETGQTHVEFARVKEQLFDRWCNSKKIEKNHEKLRQLMLVEEFKSCIHSDVKSFLDEKQVETLEAAARLADDYSLTHKTSFVNKPTSFVNKPTSFVNRPASFVNRQTSFVNRPTSFVNKPTSFVNKPSPNRQQLHPTPSTDSLSSKPRSFGDSRNRSQFVNRGQNPLSQITCHYCKKPGHLKSDCYLLKSRQSGEMKPTGFTTLRSKPQSCFESDSFVDVVKPKSDSVMEVYEPFLSEGFVSLSCDLCPPTPIKILRDTGASQSLIVADVLPFVIIRILVLVYLFRV